MDKFQEIIKKLKKLGKSKVLLACSTGVDSMVLLSLLKEANLNFSVAHVNHNYREESEIEAAFISNYCSENNIDLYYAKLDKYEGSGFEEWAREQRYGFFYDIMNEEGFKYILLAHHADDNLETSIMKFFKKAPLSGIIGMSEVNEVDIGSKYVTVLRPMLNLQKDEIYEYAHNQDIQYFEDVTNESDDFERNRIRHKLIPVLKELCPNLFDCYNNFIYNAKNSSEIVSIVVEQAMADIVRFNEYKNYHIMSFSYEYFNSLEEFIQKELLFKLLDIFNLSIKNIEDIINALKKSKLIYPINEISTIVKEYGMVKIIFGNLENNVERRFNKPGTLVFPDGTRLVIKQNPIIKQEQKSEICYNAKEIYVDQFPIVIRNKGNGDKLSLKQGTVSVSDFLTNKKICYLDRLNTYVVSEDGKISKLLIYNQEGKKNGRKY